MSIMKNIIALGSIGLLMFSHSAIGAEHSLYDKKSKKGKKAKKGTMEQMKRKGTFISVLNSAQNPVECDSNALGNALMTYDEGVLCVALSYQGLVNGDIENRSHIHGPAAIGMPYADIITTFYNRNTPMEIDYPGTNKNVCYNLDDVNEEKGLPPGTIEDYLFDGLLLINIHSDTCDKGEIRGQILPM